MNKLKAGALQLTLFIAVVIALLLAAFVILVHTHKRFGVQSDMLVNSVKNAHYGIDYGLRNPLPTNDSIIIRTDDIGEVEVKKGFWGMLETLNTSSTIKNKTFKKTALVGALQKKQDRTALYLRENKNPLVVAGNTKIQGVAYLPKRGVKTGTISGQSYYGERLIYGPTKFGGQLPELNPETVQYITAIQKSLETFNSDQIIELGVNKTHQNSFYKPVKYILSTTDIRLSQTTLIGHIIIRSNTKIIVDASTNLKDVLLIAPKIAILDNVTGNFQAFASKEINIGTNCQLNYPSALILKEAYKRINTSSTVKDETFKIHIDNNSKVKGFVVYLGSHKSKNVKPQIILEKSATVIGEVYCNANFELRGIVQGSVFTNNFIANQAGSIYQNHVYNGTISVDSLPLEYAGLPFKKSKKGIIKWLY